jgi:hypothetical protein
LPPIVQRSSGRIIRLADSMTQSGIRFLIQTP